jgi:hypothetical protein
LPGSPVPEAMPVFGVPYRFIDFEQPNDLSRQEPSVST